MSSLRRVNKKPVKALSCVNNVFNKHHTWTPSTMEYYTHQIINTEINTITITNLELFNVSITNRINLYEQRYRTCMNKQSQLSNWIKTIQAKGPPSPLNEGYTPPSRSSILSDYFNLPSLSSKKPNQKKPVCHEQASTVKTSFSTFIKKATDTLSTKPSKRQHKSAEERNHSSSRFSFSTSLNRFSLSKGKMTIHQQQNKRFSMPCHDKNQRYT